MSYFWDLYNLQNEDTKKLIRSQVLGTEFSLNIKKKKRKKKCLTTKGAGFR